VFFLANRSPLGSGPPSDRTELAAPPRAAAEPVLGHAIADAPGRRCRRFRGTRTTLRVPRNPRLLGDAMGARATRRHLSPAAASCRRVVRWDQRRVEARRVVPTIANKPVPRCSRRPARWPRASTPVASDCAAVSRCRRTSISPCRRPRGRATHQRNSKTSTVHHVGGGASQGPKWTCLRQDLFAIATQVAPRTPGGSSRSAG